MKRKREAEERREAALKQPANDIRKMANKRSTESSEEEVGNGSTPKRRDLTGV